MTETQAKRYMDHDAWKEAAEALGLKGPVRAAGHKSFAYVGEDGEPYAVWHGELDYGTVNENYTPPHNPLFVKHENATAGYSQGVFTEKQEAPPWARPNEPKVSGNTTLTPLDPTAGVPIKQEK